MCSFIGSGLSIFDEDALQSDNETDIVTLVVVTKEERPYVMLKKGKTGNSAYDGFAIDLLKVYSQRQCSFRSMGLTLMSRVCSTIQ